MLYLRCMLYIYLGYVLCNISLLQRASERDFGLLTAQDPALKGKQKNKTKKSTKEKHTKAFIFILSFS